MKREYFKVFFIMIGFSLLLASLLYFLGEQYKIARNTEIAKEREVMDEIGDFYKLFNEKTEEFSTKHDEFIKLVDDATAFYKNVPDNYNILIDSVKNFEIFLIEIDDMDNFLYDKCYRKFYSDSAVNTNCLAYLRNVEKEINTFIEDVKYLNKRIEAYNEWTDVENQSVIAERHYDKVETFKSEKFTDYVDKDGDGVQLGNVSE